MRFLSTAPELMPALRQLADWEGLLHRLSSNCMLSIEQKKESGNKKTSTREVLRIFLDCSKYQSPHIIPENKDCSENDNIADKKENKSPLSCTRADSISHNSALKYDCSL